ncbi:MAG TPA: O-methyltransferase [Propionibacteriaceae bacterium]|nr:O-methyltransferase [Propionibacteriaceae bacterium]
MSPRECPYDPVWAQVDNYLAAHLATDDELLIQARAATQQAGMPAIEVSATQGKLLALLARIVGAGRVLEIGTLGGYSTIHLARAVAPHGHVTSLEISPAHAAVAEQNLSQAGVADIVDVVVGPAIESLQRMIDAGAPLYDLVFIDADKASNSAYVEAALHLSHPGTVIVVDNVVRHGGIVDPDSDDESVRGSRAVIELVGSHPRLDATAMQTVGAKGYDGFLLALVR